MESNLTMYMKEFSKWPLLSAAEEIELAEKIKAGDANARERLINCNLRLVVKIAKDFSGNKNVSFDDLISAGNLGLITAVDKFDTKYGCRFSTCATPWIRQSIMKCLQDHGRIVRLPAHIIQLINSEKKARAELGDHASNEEMAAKMGITLDKFNALQSWKLNSVSLDTPLDYDDSESDTVGDLIADNGETPTDYANKMDLTRIIDELLAGLDSRKQTIMRMRFGWGIKESTLDEIGEKVGLSKERVRQIVNEVVAMWKASGKFDSFANLI